MDENTFADFYKDGFDIDDFLNKQTETSELKEILYSLNEMKNKNSNKMTTVLREKTDAVILIAEQLQSLHKKIDNLQSPLSQLKEEIQVLVKRVRDVVNSYDQNITNAQNINSTKGNLSAIRAYKVILLQTHTLMKTFMSQEDIDFEGLERLICKYAFHAYILHKQEIKDPDVIRPSVDASIKIILRDTFLRAYKVGNRDRITRIIDMFVYLGMLQSLKEIVCDNIIKPRLSPIFCEENLRACGNEMSLVYGQALAILEHDLKMLIQIIKNENVNIDIILDCYWSVVDRLLRTNLVTITAAGHPDLFFKHFNATHLFLKDIGRIYGNVELCKENASFIEHLKRFNLLVYYEIRHQYVSSSFELVILKSSEFSDSQELEKLTRPINNYFLQLKTSIALDILIEYLFSRRVFIAMISEQFMKSALLLCARYSSWVKDCLMPALKIFAPLNHELVVVAVRLINDLNTLNCKLTRDYSEIDTAINASLRNSIQGQFKLTFDALYQEIADYLVKYHLDKIKDDLKNVSDIPRLYRKTNRTLPKSSSSYVKDAFKDVRALNSLVVKTENSKEILFGAEHKSVLRELLECATKEYNTMVHSVLNAVFKTEESLKRLKSRNVGSSDSNNPQGSSDEAKIRLQIKLDVQEFVKNVRGFSVDELETDVQALLLQIENC